MSDMSLRALSEAIAGILGLFRELVMTLLFGLWDGGAQPTMIDNVVECDRLHQQLAGRLNGLVRSPRVCFPQAAPRYRY